MLDNNIQRWTLFRTGWVLENKILSDSLAGHMIEMNEILGTGSVGQGRVLSGSRSLVVGACSSSRGSAKAGNMVLQSRAPLALQRS